MRFFEKVFVTTSIVLMLYGTATPLPANVCRDALVGCRSDCGGGWLGEACGLGCYIGYLNCIY